MAVNGNYCVKSTQCFYYAILMRRAAKIMRQKRDMFCTKLQNKY